MSYKAYKGDSLQLVKESPFFWDHVTRYWWASELAKNLSVLDCASGKGYGPFILAQNAQHVLGIDLNETSLMIAEQSFSQQKNLSFKKQNALKLFELGKKFDLITAFEVIEHIPPEQTDDFLKSLKSALSPNGRLIISTPNHDVVLKSRSSVPSFHINNFPATKLKQKLQEHFPQVQMLGQYRQRSGIQKIIYDLDFLNLRHVLKNIGRAPSKTTDESLSSELDHDVLQDQKLIAQDFLPRPNEVDQYRFSPNHWRQSGLSIAICS